MSSTSLLSQTLQSILNTLFHLSLSLDCRSFLEFELAVYSLDLERLFPFVLQVDLVSHSSDDLGLSELVDDEAYS